MGRTRDKCLVRLVSSQRALLKRNTLNTSYTANSGETLGCHGDPDVWVTRDGEHLTREEFARIVQNTTTPVIVNPAELRWYEHPVDE